MSLNIPKKIIKSYKYITLMVLKKLNDLQTDQISDHKARAEK